MPNAVLYCCDPLNPRRVDQYFASEAREVRARGGVVALVDHDALLHGDADRAVERVPDGLGTAWYRGWMIPSDCYESLAGALASRDGGLLVSPDKYRIAHELPGWYRTFLPLTPASAWRWAAGRTPATHDLAALVEQLRPGPGIVKDYVKSRKHEWQQACFVPDLQDTAGLARIVNSFVKLQGEFLAGGIVLREYEPFVTSESTATEIRVWWLDGRPAMLTPHPDSAFPHGPVPELEHVEALVRELGCRFITTDLALRTDGAWRVVEVGDGQVSDLHSSSDRAQLAALLVDT